MSAPSPNFSELMQLFKLDDNDDLADPETRPESRVAPPPAPTATRSTSVAKSRKKGVQSSHGDACPDPPYATFQRAQPIPTGGWNSSTQVARTAAKPLKHQLLCRNALPQGPTISVDRKTANQLLQRLSKATISSRMKGTANNTIVGDSGREQLPAKPIEVDRKRLHLQQRQAATRHNTPGHEGDVPVQGMRSGREGIELLLFYRKEVDKRLRADPLYALHHDIQAYE